MSSLSGSWANRTGMREARGILATATTINLSQGTKSMNIRVEKRDTGHGHHNKPVTRHPINEY